MNYSYSFEKITIGCSYRLKIALYTSGLQKNFLESFEVPRLTESEHQQEPRFSRLKVFSHDGPRVHQCFSTAREPVDWVYLTTWEICR